MPSARSSARSTSASMPRPAFVAEYQASPATPIRPAIDPTKTRCPVPGRR